MTTEKQGLALAALTEGLQELEEVKLLEHLDVVIDQVAELEEDLDCTKYQLVELCSALARSHELARAVGELLKELGTLPLPPEVLFRLRMTYTEAEQIAPI